MRPSPRILRDSQQSDERVVAERHKSDAERGEAGAVGDKKEALQGEEQSVGVKEDGEQEEAEAEEDAGKR